MRDYFQAFHEELEKLAFSPRASAVLGGLGAGAGTGLLTGGVLGAGLQGYRGYQDAKEHGASGLQAAASGLSGAVQGATTGAGLGALAGGLGGGALGFQKPELAGRLRSALTETRGPVGAFARFGQRQVHGVTGWLPQEGRAGLHELRHGSFDVQKDLDQLHANASAPAADLARAERRVAASRAAEDMGLTSIPGYVKSLVSRDPDKGVGNTLRTAVNEQLHGTTNTQKALMLGMPAMGVAGAALSHDDPEHPNPQGSKGVRVAKSLANLGTGVLLGPMPQTTQMLLGTGVDTAITTAGKLRRRRGVPRPMESAGSRPSRIVIAPENEKPLGPPVEYEMSPAARGQAPEGVA